MYSPPNPAEFNALVWDIARQIPEGRVSTYGQIASMIPPPAGVDPLQHERLAPRWVGGAMYAAPDGQGIPWQRVINGKGEISLRADGDAHTRQRLLLEAEGVEFDGKGRVDFGVCGWDGPPAEWLAEHGLMAPRLLRPPDARGAIQQSLF